MKGGLPGAGNPAGVGLSHGAMAAAERRDRERRSEASSTGGDAPLVDLVVPMLRVVRSLPPKERVAKQDLSKEDFFPLPLPRGSLTPLCKMTAGWEEGIIRSLNFLSTGSFALGEQSPTKLQEGLLREIRCSLPVVEAWKNFQVPEFHPQSFWTQKHVNSYGEEVHVAQSVRWENVDCSLPKADVAGIVPAVDLCTGGMKDFLLHPEKWLKPEAARTWMRPPKVMVPQDGWDDLVQGLLERNLCGIMPLSEVFSVDGSPILGGLFGVPKGESKDDGTPILRLIMDLRAINQNFISLGGDLSTLPVLSQLFQLQLMPHEQLVISSEDIRAMFYVIGLPLVWAKYLCFGKTISSRFNPPGVSEPCVLYSKVLPMGYLNSVALAQAIHRRIVEMAVSPVITSDHEIRRDRELPQVATYYRTYLDNFDCLSKRSQAIIEQGEPSLVELLQKQYEELGVPRNEKKAVSNASRAEMQGAIIDGTIGVGYAKPEKAARYLQGLLHVVQKGRASQKQLQILAGGLVYLFSFRRPLMSTLNDIWRFIASFTNDRRSKPLPAAVLRELVASFFLAGVSYMNFRLPIHEVVTASDASESGGGLSQSIALTEQGQSAAQRLVRGQMGITEPRDGLLVISCFDGIGSLRVALDCLQCPLTGYIAIECKKEAVRVLESFFPNVESFPNIEEVTAADLLIWAAKFPSCIAVLVAGGPPCQGVSSLNASKKGALADPRSCLYQTFSRLVQTTRSVFTWCPVFCLMESVFSMSEVDRSHYSRGIGLLPYLVDSKGVSLCRRPRLWWFDWVIHHRDGVSVTTPQSSEATDYGEIVFTAEVDPKGILAPGWRLTSEDARFSTFTTAQPKDRPGFKPAGLASCTSRDLAHWEEDRFRFPPFTYRFTNGVLHKKKGWRLLSIEEKEMIMGFPKGFTLHSSTKSARKSQPVSCDDLRMTLVGNAWHVGVAALLVHDLLVELKLIQPRSVQSIVDSLRPGSASDLSGFLFRPGWPRRQPFKQVSTEAGPSQQLVEKLSHLVSSKGSDILLTAGTEPSPHFHRFRTSIPSSLWRWKEVCGWPWPSSDHSHINKLEMKAVYTSLKWRVARQRTHNHRILHLVDSMVSLQVLNKGRSSSFKLKRVTQKITALLVSSRLFLILAYVGTHENPADRPSRRPVKRKWGKSVR